jgi:hypothetical protein
VTKLLDERAPDEARGARDQHLHGRRVYWRACALLPLVLLAGCDHGSRHAAPQPPPAPRLSFVALDRQQQRLVRHYEPVSAALTGWELAFRDWRLGRLSTSDLVARARSYRSIVLVARGRLRADLASGETRRARRLFVAGLAARAEALAALPDLGRYTPLWSRSVVNARAGLTLLQNVRDRARLIPLPEDAVS